MGEKLKELEKVPDSKVTALQDKLKDLASSREFEIAGTMVEGGAFGNGLINDTLVATFDNEGRYSRFVLQRINREEGVAVVMVCHDLQLAGRFFGRLVLLKDGRIFKDGSAAEVLVRPVLEEAFGCSLEEFE